MQRVNDSTVSFSPSLVVVGESHQSIFSIFFLEPRWWETAFPSIPTNLSFTVAQLFEKEKGRESLSVLSKMFSSSLLSLGGKLEDVDTAFVINNPKLRISLENAINLLEGKLGDTRSLFQKDDWKTEGGEETDKKRKNLALLGDFASSFDGPSWNDGSRPPVIPLIQKMPKQLALLVAQHGFGILPVPDSGKYGNGIYFSNALGHVNASYSYSHLVHHLNWGSKVEDAYLISLVLPGTPFPLVDRFDHERTGIPCRPGYQSHFVTTTNEKNGFESGELVIFDLSQALAVLIWIPTKKTFESLGKTPLITTINLQNQFFENTHLLEDAAAPVVRKEWNHTLDATWKRKWNLSFAVVFLLRSPTHHVGIPL